MDSVVKSAARFFHIFCIFAGCGVFQSNFSSQICCYIILARTITWLSTPRGSSFQNLSISKESGEDVRMFNKWVDVSCEGTKGCWDVDAVSLETGSWCCLDAWKLETGSGPDKRYPSLDCTAVGPFPRTTLSWTIYQIEYESAPISNDISKSLSFVTGWASFKPCKYGRADIFWIKFAAVLSKHQCIFSHCRL